MARKKTLGNYVVLVDCDCGTGERVEVCCGQRFATEAAALKEAQEHADSDVNWIAIAKIVQIGKSAGFTFTKV